MEQRTILEVRKRKGDKSNHKVWYIKRCDQEPAFVGLPTASGVPMRAEDAPEGTTFETILRIPDHKESSKEPT